MKLSFLKLIIFFLLSNPILSAEWINFRIETSHPYPNNYSEQWRLENLEASSIKLKCEKLSLGKGDKLVFAVKNSSEIISTLYGPIDLNNWESKWMNYSSLTLKITSDRRLNQYGLKCHGFLIKRRALSTPKVVSHDILDLKLKSIKLGHYLFFDNKFYINQEITQANGLPVGNFIRSFDLSTTNFIEENSISTYHRSYGPILKLDDIFYSGENGLISNSQNNKTFELIKPHDNLNQIKSHNEFIYVTATNKIHIIDTKGDFGWQYANNIHEMISIKDYDRFNIYKNKLVINRPYKKVLDIYDISNSYSIGAPTSSPISVSNYDYVLDNWVPTLENNHAFLPSNRTLSSYNLNSGVEVDYITFPLKIGDHANTFYSDSRTIYVSANTTIYRVDISNPSSLKLIDSFKVTKDRLAGGILKVHQYKNFLYVLRENIIDGKIDTNSIILTIVQLPN